MEGFGARQRRTDHESAKVGGWGESRAFVGPLRELACPRLVAAEEFSSCRSLFSISNFSLVPVMFVDIAIMPCPSPVVQHGYPTSYAVVVPLCAGDLESCVLRSRIPLYSCEATASSGPFPHYHILEVLPSFVGAWDGRLPSVSLLISVPAHIAVVGTGIPPAAAARERLSWERSCSLPLRVSASSRAPGSAKLDVFAGLFPFQLLS